MQIHHALLTEAGALGPRFLEPVLFLGVVAGVVAAIGLALLLAYAIVAGVLRLWHR